MGLDNRQSLPYSSIKLNSKLSSAFILNDFIVTLTCNGHLKCTKSSAQKATRWKTKSVYIEAFEYCKQPIWQNERSMPMNCVTFIVHPIFGWFYLSKRQIVDDWWQMAKQKQCLSNVMNRVKEVGNSFNLSMLSVDTKRDKKSARGKDKSIAQTNSQKITAKRRWFCCCCWMIVE